MKKNRLFYVMYTASAWFVIHPSLHASSDVTHVTPTLHIAHHWNTSDSVEVTAKNPAVIQLQIAPGGQQIVEFKTTGGQLAHTQVVSSSDGFVETELLANGDSGEVKVTAYINNQPIAEQILTLVNENSDAAQLATHEEEYRVFFHQLSQAFIGFSDAQASTQSSSQVSFRVVNEKGEGVKGATVYFSVSDPLLAQLEHQQSLSNDEGIVTVQLNANQQQGDFRVLAGMDHSASQTLSPQILVNNHLPDQDSFSVWASNNDRSFEVIDHPHTQILLNASLADQYNHRIQNGHWINFRVETGVITGCEVMNGLCQTELTVGGNGGNPYVPRGHHELDNPNYLHNVCFQNHIQQTNTYCAGDSDDRMGYPRGGRLTVMGYTNGQESFWDANGNGVLDTEREQEAFYKINYNTQEPFDYYEPFLDTNGDGIFLDQYDPVRDSHLTPRPYTYEPFIDTNGDGQWTRQDGIFAGPCSNLGLWVCDPNINSTIIHESEELCLLGSDPYVTWGNISSDQKLYVSQNRPTVVKFSIADLNNHALPKGTTITFDSTDVVLEDISFITDDGYESRITSEQYQLQGDACKGNGVRNFEFLIRGNGALGEGRMSIIVKTPKGFTQYFTMNNILETF